MARLEQRVRLLEASARPANCLECEMERLNLAAASSLEPAKACTHRRGVTLLDALMGLNAMEIAHAQP
jgi:hypothetical protein